MKTFTAKDAKNQFGTLMDTAHNEPVVITKRGKEFLVILSVEKYKDIEAIEDAYWSEKAKQSIKEKPLGTQAGYDLLSDLLGA
jgi:prevent-host-death family protein